MDDVITPGWFVFLGPRFGRRCLSDEEAVVVGEDGIEAKEEAGGVPEGEDMVHEAGAAALVYGSKKPVLPAKMFEGSRQAFLALGCPERYNTCGMPEGDSGGLPLAMRTSPGTLTPSSGGWGGFGLIYV